LALLFNTFRCRNFSDFFGRPYRCPLLLMGLSYMYQAVQVYNHLLGESIPKPQQNEQPKRSKEHRSGKLSTCLSRIKRLHCSMSHSTSRLLPCCFLFCARLLKNRGNSVSERRIRAHRGIHCRTHISTPRTKQVALRRCRETSNS